MWIIETGIEPDYEQRLIKSAQTQGHETYSPLILPFGEGARKPDEEKRPLPEKGFFHGSIQGCTWANTYSNWTVYANFQQFECSYYYPRLREYILNEQHVFMPWGSFCEQKDLVFNLYEDEPVFVRPSSGKKQFTGLLVYPNMWEEDKKFMSIYGIDPEELVVIAPPQNIVREYRFFVSMGKVITGSRYAEGHDHTRAPLEDEELWWGELFADQIHNDGYSPNPIWVMDMCLTKAGEYKILEVGAFSCSGLYLADTDKLVERVSEIQGQ